MEWGYSRVRESVMTVSKTTIARLGRLQKVEILHKDGALNAEEFQIMRNHTIDGRNVLIGQPDVDPAWAESAYSHHEALDGTGYPRKIKASGISDLTRIVTICDVYDAITSDRCYRNGQSFLRAMDLLNHQAGLKFDTQRSAWRPCRRIRAPGTQHLLMALLGREHTP